MGFGLNMSELGKSLIPGRESLSYLSKKLWAPIGLCTSVYADFSRVVGSRTVAFYVITPLAVSTLTTMFSYHMDIAQNRAGDGAFLNYLKIGDDEHSAAQAEVWAGFIEHLTNFASLAFTNAILNTVSSVVEERCKIGLSRAVQSKIDNQLYSDQGLIAASLEEEMKSKMLRQSQDARSVINETGGVLVSSANAAFSGFLGLYSLLALNWSIPMLALAYSRIDLYIATTLAEKTREASRRQAVAETEVTALNSHALNNARSIVETDGESFVANDIAKRREEIYKLQDTKYWWSAGSGLWSLVSGYSNFVFRLLMMGYYLKQGIIKVGDRPVIEVAMSKINQLVQWNSYYLQTIIEIELNSDRLRSIIDNFAKHKDRERRLTISYDSTNDRFIEISGLTMSYQSESGDNNLITDVTKLTLERGKTYAIRGGTGSGKSTFLAKLRGIDSDQVKVKGTVNFAVADATKVVLIPQQDFFPMNKSLLETICYPKQVNDSDRSKINILLQAANQAGLADRLDEVTDFNKSISGGQKKVIKIISAILHRPDVLLLDETLTGLDNDICTAIQELIKKYLPNTTILVVDHTIEANNRNVNGKPFYDEILDFSNKTINVKRLQQERSSTTSFSRE